jgi:glycosyltransferase involved in cell wall biosynthesis
MNKKLSVIVPVYNGEKFIEICLNSLVHQVNDNVEIIVINDGSTDDTDHIITSKFKAFIDSGNFQYMPTQNGGVSVARNMGLGMASGEYVAFVDADDVVSTNYVKTVLKATTEAPSIIEFGYRTINQQGEVLKDRCFVHTKFGKHNADTVLNNVFAACLWYPFVRVFRRELFNKIQFPSGVNFCEDVMTLSVIYKSASEILTLPVVLYDYRINPYGATLNVKPDYAENLIAFYRCIAPDKTFANNALKLGLAYAIRSCIVKTSDPLGRMPPDIEADVRALVLSPRLLFRVRRRFAIYAIFGPALYFIRGLLKHHS